MPEQTAYARLYACAPIFGSKGQMTIPKQVRGALELRAGDQVVFRVDGKRAVIARTLDLIELAGSVPVPLKKRGRSWDEIRRETRSARARRAG